MHSKEQQGKQQQGSQRQGAGQENAARQRILIISHALTKPDVSAGDRRLFALIEMLAQRYDVDFCSTYDEFRHGCKPDPQMLRYREMLEATGARLIEAQWRSVPTALAQNRYDAAFLEFYHVAAKYIPYLRATQPGIKIIVDSVDVHFAREQSGAALGALDAARIARTKSRELAAYRAADAVVVVTNLDAALLEREGAMPPLTLLPIIMPTRPRPALRREHECLFIGGFMHPPNLDGLSWFCKEVWPLVRARVDDARLTIIGSNAPPEVDALAQSPGVQSLGFVRDTAPNLDRALVSIAPLRYGAGMKGKVTEAMAWGLPVVSTTVGAQGLDVTDGREMRVADTPEGFANALCDLFLAPDKAAQIGLAGQQYIAGVCSPDVVQTALYHMMDALLPAQALAHPRPLARLRWQTAALALGMVGAIMMRVRPRPAAQ